MKDLYKYKGFKLLELKTINHKVLGTNNFSFVNQDDKLDGLYTTIIIGPNGTGKSNLLRFIIDIFRTLKSLQIGDKRGFVGTEVFYLRYSLQGHIYEFSNSIRNFLNKDFKFIAVGEKKSYTLIVDGEERRDFAQSIFMPLSIVAQSIMLTDKYPVLNKKEEDKFEEYNYLGVKNRPQQASTRSYERRTIEFIIKNMHLDPFRDALTRITNFLEVQDSVEIIYRTKNTSKFFWGELTKEEFDNYFEEIKEKYVGRLSDAPFKLNHYLKLKESQPEIIVELIDYCNKLYRTNRLNKISKSVSKELKFQLTENESHKEVKNEYKYLEQLRMLGLLTNPEINLFKKKSSRGFDLRSSSSGEFHFFSTVIGLIAAMKINSLVFIDEPEISLHPNWQMRFLSFLREIFRNSDYSTCHIIVATHSHFLISDLEGSQANIINMSQSERGPLAKNIHSNTFGWSAEEVLYEVFGVATSRNYFINNTISEILELMADENSNGDLIVSRINDLRSMDLNFKKEDPMKDIVEELFKKLDDAQ